MLIPFSAYRRTNLIRQFTSLVVLNTLLLLGLATKTVVTPEEWAFAVAAIIAGVSYASIRDVPGLMAYAEQSPKFYRDEADFTALGRYASGRRKLTATCLGHPLIAALILGAGLTGLYLLGTSHWPELPRLLTTSLALVLVYPLILSGVTRFLTPIFVGWKEIAANSAQTPSSPASLPRRLRRTAAEDLTVTALITAALVLPVRHSVAFQHLTGYDSIDFILAALILVLIVLPLTLFSAWRTRLHACAGELYRDQHLIPPAAPTDTTVPSRWRRWLRYSLLLCALTAVTCLTVGALLPELPVEIILALLLAPLVPIFWRERSLTLSANAQDAAALLRAFPPHNLNLERMLELLKAE